jgi:hypothetical protein
MSKVRGENRLDVKQRQDGMLSFFLSRNRLSTLRIYIFYYTTDFKDTFKKLKRQTILISLSSRHLLSA